MQGDTAEIKNFHVHVYFDPETRETAGRVRDGLAERFDVELGRWHEKPIGPHPKSMYQVKFSPSEFGALVPWLMLNHQELDVLIHPSTDDAVSDHTDNALWLGKKLELNIDVLKGLSATKQGGKS